jgi:hypothetical protein
VIVRPKYACPGKDGGVVQAPPPPAPTVGGRFGFSFVANLITSRFADHLPYYRLQDVFARSGLEISRSTLRSVAREGYELVRPLVNMMRLRLIASGLTGADDTPVRLLDRNSPGGSVTARFWLYHGFAASPYDVFQFHHSRERDGPARFLEDFKGWVKVDAYGVREGVYLGSGGRIMASCCWGHARRKFYDAKAYPALRCEGLAYIHRLYDIEDRARALSDAERQAMRMAESAPILDRMGEWLAREGQRALPKSDLRKAMNYATNQWKPLVSYLQDGRLPIDNNSTESTFRR